MKFYEVLLIIIILCFVLFVFGKQIYKKIKHKPSGECACCAMKSKRIIKKIKRSLETERCHEKNNK